MSPQAGVPTCSSNLTLGEERTLSPRLQATLTSHAYLTKPHEEGKQCHLPFTHSKRGAKNKEGTFGRLVYSVPERRVGFQGTTGGR